MGKEHGINKIGMKYGKLTIIKKIGVDKFINSVYQCKCDCGNLKDVSNANIGKGVKSCGCLSMNIKLKHGHVKNIKIGHKKYKTNTSITYVAWRGVISGLKSNQKRGRVRDYIDFDESWKDFNVFLKDMGEKPPYTRLTRYDKDGDYCKYNCYWKPIGVKNLKDSINSNCLSSKPSTKAST